MSLRLRVYRLLFATGREARVGPASPAVPSQDRLRRARRRVRRPPRPRHCAGPLVSRCRHDMNILNQLLDDAIIYHNLGNKSFLSRRITATHWVPQLHAACQMRLAFCPTAESNRFMDVSQSSNLSMCKCVM